MAHLLDKPSGYGWVSILFHWSSAVVIVAMWLLGSNIRIGDIVSPGHLHVSTGVCIWLPMLFRIAWRMRAGHPQLAGQSMVVRRLASTTHYAILAAVFVMLLSGPLLVWSDGLPIRVFDWFAIPGPFDGSDRLREIALLVHSTTAMLLLYLVLIHVGGALKHLMFHNDETFVRMLWPRRGREPKSADD
ncbi:MAG: cytochrome b/b6 domain-containing protein [Haliea sp.]